MYSTVLGMEANSGSVCIFLYIPFSRKSNFLVKIVILVKSVNFGQKSYFSKYSEKKVKNHNLGQKIAKSKGQISKIFQNYNFWAKSKILAKNDIFGQ